MKTLTETEWSNGQIAYANVSYSLLTVT